MNCGKSKARKKGKHWKYNKKSTKKENKKNIEKYNEEIIGLETFGGRKLGKIK